MYSGSHRPTLSEAAVRKVLNAMETATPLPPEHPLRFFLTIGEELSAPYTLTGEAAVEVIIFGYVANVITEQLGFLRAPYGIPPPTVHCSHLHIEEDFQQHNQELEAWSVLYHRYVCVGHNFQMQNIAAIVQRDSRSVRRRQTLGVTRLTHRLIEDEQAARRRHAEERLRLALPHAHPPILIGRDTWLEEAAHVLTAADPPCHLLLYGPHGVGKTALAEGIAHTLIAEGNLDDLAWLHGNTLSGELSAALFEIATQLGLPLQASSDFRGTLRAYLYRHPTLIVIDGAESLVHDTEALTALLGMLDMALVVLTSRTRAKCGALYAISVPELSYDSAFAFLEWHAAHHAPVDTMWEEHFDAIWEAVGGNPLALQTTLDATRSLPLDEALSSALTTHVYARIWEQLPTHARSVWLLTLFFPRGQMSYSDLRTLLRWPQPVLHQALSTLADAALLERHERDQRTFYTYPPHIIPFLRELARQRHMLTSEEDAHTFLQRVYPRRLTQLVRLPDARTALLLLRMAEDLRFDQVLRWRGVYEVGPQIMQAGLWAAWRRILEAMTQHAHPTEHQVWLQWMLGVAARWMGQLHKAREHLERALALCVPKTSEYASIQVEMGVIARYQGHWGETHRLLREALEFYQQHNLYAGVERCVHELAQLELEAERPQHALALLSRLERRTARTWGIISQAHLQQQELLLAQEAAEHVLALLPPQHPNRARTLATLGEIALARGDVDAVLENLLLAADQLEQARDILGYARACNNLAAAYLHYPPEKRRLRTEELRRLLTDALNIQTYAGDEIGQAVSRRNLALLDLGRENDKQSPR